MRPDYVITSRKVFTAERGVDGARELALAIKDGVVVSVAARDHAAELAQETNIVAIKEATGDISQVAEMCRVVPEDFAVYSGNDDMVVPLMSLGGKGVISVTANVIPADITAMTHYALEGDYANAARIQLATKPLTDALFADVNPIPVKAALAMMGKMEMTYRLPLCAPSEAVQARLRTEMEAYGLL